MTGSFRYVNCYPIAIDLVASKRIDVTKIVTHRVSNSYHMAFIIFSRFPFLFCLQYTFEDSMKAFEATFKGKGEDGKGTIKVQICQGKA